MRFAQTHLQLLMQAREAGYGREEILTLRQDYETVCRLFGHMGRHNGRPFHCHLVGTASLAIAEEQDFVLVRAALNHAAYDVGRFPSGARGMRADHVRWLKSRIGEEVEALIVEYYKDPVGIDAVIEKSKRPLDHFPPEERRVVALELCNEVDDGRDYGASLDKGIKWRTPAYVQSLIRLSETFNMRHCLAGYKEIEAQIADSGWLQPDIKFTYSPHRQSAPRYIKDTLRAGWLRLRGESYHY